MKQKRNWLLSLCAGLIISSAHGTYCADTAKVGAQNTTDEKVDAQPTLINEDQQQQQPSLTRNSSAKNLGMLVLKRVLSTGMPSYPGNNNYKIAESSAAPSPLSFSIPDLMQWFPSQQGAYNLY